MSKRLTAGQTVAEKDPTPTESGKFAVDDWVRLERFIILGSEQNRYTSGENQTLNLQSSRVLERCIRVDGERVVDTVVNISELGRAPKNDVALFAMAAVTKLGSEKVRVHAYENLHRVVRTGTHLLNFMRYAKTLKKGGAGFRRAVNRKLLASTIEQAAYQMLKYQQRDGFSQRDVARLTHPGVKASLTPEQHNLLNYVVRGKLEEGNDKVPKFLQGFLEMKALAPLLESKGQGKMSSDPARHAEAVSQAITLIKEYGLTREMLPSELLNQVEVWEALLQKMPLTAMIRNLGKMTNIGLITPGSEAEKLVVQRLSDEVYLRRSRIHPLNVLTAQRAYAAGESQRGGSGKPGMTWTPTPGVLNALEATFYKTFINAPVTGKRYYIGIDCSGSMKSAFPGSSLKSIEAAVALAMVTQAIEPDTYIAGYAAGDGRRLSTRILGAPHMEALDIRRGMKIEEACKKALALNWGSTDCALPYKDALARKEQYDCFINITDNDHNTGNVTPAAALREYREQTGIPAKQVVIGTYNSPFSIADPNDTGSLDIAGFDSATPALVADFASDGKLKKESEEADE